MQFKCLDCDSIVVNEELVFTCDTESRPYGEGFATEDVSECFCPYCNGTEIELIF